MPKVSNSIPDRNQYNQAFLTIGLKKRLPTQTPALTVLAQGTGTPLIARATHCPSSTTRLCRERSTDTNRILAGDAHTQSTVILLTRSSSEQCPVVIPTRGLCARGRHTDNLGSFICSFCKPIHVYSMLTSVSNR